MKDVPSLFNVAHLNNGGDGGGSGADDDDNNNLFQNIQIYKFNKIKIIYNYCV